MHLDDSGKGVRGSEKKQASKLSRILCGLTLYKCIVHWRMCLLHFSTACNFEFLFRNELIKTNHTKENKRHTHTHYHNIRLFILLYGICMDPMRLHTKWVREMWKKLVPTTTTTATKQYPTNETSLICMRARSGWNR